MHSETYCSSFIHCNLRLVLFILHNAQVRIYLSRILQIHLI